MNMETLPFEHRPRNSIANNLDKINELVDWVNQDTHLYASATGESVTVDDASSVKGLTVDGRSVQDGTPTPDSPVPVQVVEGRNIGVKVVYATKRIRGWAGGDGILHFGNSESMTARVCKGQAITVSGTGNRFFLSLFSDEPTTERQKSLWTIAPYGTGVQTEPRTYTVEINRNGWLLAYINAAESDTVRDDSSFFAMREIDIQGNVLASLPDGTRDELHVDSAGHCVLTKTVSHIASYNGESVGSVYMSTTGQLTTGAEVYYKASSASTIDLGYIAPPAIPSGSVVTVSASLTPTFHLEWWVDDGITELVNDLIAYIDYKTEG